MSNKTAWVVLFFILIFIFCSVVYSQAQFKQLLDPAFKSHQRCPVRFFHDKHNQKAAIYDCSVCHHLYKDGKLIKGAMSIGMKCSQCHAIKPTDTNNIDLMKAYHNLCIGCHKNKKKGPITCGECHKKP